MSLLEKLDYYKMSYDIQYVISMFGVFGLFQVDL